MNPQTSPSATRQEQDIDLRSPDLYLNRELSLIEFNRRVLAQAQDLQVPLLERLRFLCITSSNLDEFFEIRNAGLKKQAVYGSVQRGPENLSPQEQLKRIADQVHCLMEEQYRVFNDLLIPALEKESIRFLKRGEWSPAQSAWVRAYFERELLPVVSPIGLDPSHPFPPVTNKSLHFLVTLEGEDDFGRDSGVAIIQAPRSLPRVIELPIEGPGALHDYVFLSSILHAEVESLFPGLQVTGCYQFRVTRNSELFVDDEEVDDLLRALEGELPTRRFSDAVRLEVANDCPEVMTDFLRAQFRLETDDVYRCNGPVNLARLVPMCDLIDRPDLRYTPFSASRPPQLAVGYDVFEAIRKGDILLHHPFQSFMPVVEFLRQAAADPHVLTIKQTLYRTGVDSAIVAALIDAARAEKEVTVVIELRARFEEEANIELANHLQAAGAHVVYGIVGYKTHAKMLLVVRREGRELRRYCHLGTGNYHARTARIYTDFGLLTSDPAMGEDVHRIFHQLTTPGKAGRLGKMLQSPFTLHKTLLGLIEREVKQAEIGKKALIIAKMNALVEVRIIQALYEASRAGVRIHLIVRGICALRPGIPGISENIEVRSVVGRFLEHERIYYFWNCGEEEVLLSSADWMGRNFFNRIESCFPIDDKALKRRVIEEGLKEYLADNTEAWLLRPDGSYRRAQPTAKQRPRAAQRHLLAKLCE